MADAWLATTIRENPALFRMICRFNLRIAQDVDASRLSDKLGQETLTKIQTSPRGSRRLGQWIESYQGPLPSPVWDYSSPVRRLALLPAGTFAQLVLTTGVAVCSPMISKLIDRSTQERFREGLGEDLYRFAVKRASLLVRDVPHRLIPANLSMQPADQMLEVGRTCLGAVLRDEPSAVLRRLELKLPWNLANASHLDISPKEHQGLVSTVERILLREIDPGLRPCFD